MEKTWKPTVAGILDIVCGVLALISFIGLIIGIAVTSGALDIPGRWAIPWFVPTILWSIAIPTLIIGILALVGGIFALQRKYWGWALTGSIAATLSLFFVGIPTIVFTAQSKDEFQ